MPGPFCLRETAVKGRAGRDGLRPIGLYSRRSAAPRAGIAVSAFGDDPAREPGQAPQVNRTKCWQVAGIPVCRFSGRTAFSPEHGVLAPRLSSAVGNSLEAISAAAQRQLTKEGTMKRQTKPFIVEVKNRRSGARQNRSIWGDIDLSAIAADAERESKDKQLPDPRRVRLSSSPHRC